MKMKKALLAFALAGPASRGGDADHWYLTPEIGGISPDYRLSLQDENWLFGWRSDARSTSTSISS